MSSENLGNRVTRNPKERPWDFALQNVVYYQTDIFLFDMKKNTNAAVLFALIIFGLSLIESALFSTPIASAQGLEYQLLEKIPGTDGLGSDLPGYIKALYNVALVIVTLSAVLMLSIGGFMYLTSAGNTASMGNAKSIIYDSLIGLVIALSAWLILYIINPDLVQTSLSELGAVTVTSAPPATPQGIGTLPPESSVDLAKQILANGNIKLNSTGDCSSITGPVTPLRNMQEVAGGKRMAACYSGVKCTSEGTEGCVDDVVRPSETMLKAIWTVGQSQGFTIQSIAGGPHAASSKHYVGQAIDITPVTQSLLDAFVAAGAASPNGNAASMCEKAGKNVGCSGGGANHIHLIFPN